MFITPPNKKWFPGVVKEYLGHRSYKIQTPYGFHIIDVAERRKDPCCSLFKSTNFFGIGSLYMVQMGFFPQNYTHTY